MNNILICKPINKQYICKLVFPKIISVIQCMLLLSDITNIINSRRGEFPRSDGWLAGSGRVGVSLIETV